MNLVVNGFLLLTALVVGFIIGRSSRKKTTIGERTDDDTKPAIQAMRVYLWSPNRAESSTQMLLQTRLSAHRMTAQLSG